MPAFPVRENLEGKRCHSAPAEDTEYQDIDHVIAAWSYVHASENASQYPEKKLGAVRDRIRAAAKRLGIILNENPNRAADAPIARITASRFEVYVPITRVDEAEHTVEGYCYVNAEVGDGWNLTRESLEDAADDYMEWGAIRVMHQPVAVGSAEAVSFDKKGAFIRAHIVDDAEWKKVVHKVYKGFSIGGKPRVVRGNVIKKFTWIETSLVDRPADPDAKFTLVRAEAANEDTCYVDVLPYDYTEVMRMFGKDEEKEKAQPPVPGAAPDAQPNPTPDAPPAPDATPGAPDAPQADLPSDEPPVPGTAPDANPAAGADLTAGAAAAPDADPGATPGADPMGDGPLNDDEMHDFAGKMGQNSAQQALDETLEASWVLHEVLTKIANSPASPEEKEQKIRLSIQQFADHIVPKLREAGVKTPDLNPEAPAPGEEPVAGPDAAPRADGPASADDAAPAEGGEPAPAEDAVPPADAPKGAAEKPQETPPAAPEGAPKADANPADASKPGDDDTPPFPPKEDTPGNDTDDTEKDKPAAPAARAEHAEILRMVEEKWLHRIESIEAELKRLQDVETQLARVRVERDQARERVEELERTPARLNAPVRFPQALSREFLANAQREAAPEASTLEAELTRLQQATAQEANEGQRLKNIAQINLIKSRLAQLA